MKTNRGGMVLAWLMTVLVVTGCGGGGSGSNNGVTNPASVTLNSISITPAAATVAKGQYAVFAATGHYSDGSSANITNQVAWSSGNTAVATISSNSGIATGITVGFTTVIASFSGMTSSATNIMVTTAAITGISISPNAPSVPKGQSVTFTAIGTYSDGTTGNISSSVSWLSSNPTVATINTSGLTSTLAQGATTVTATTNSIESKGYTLIVSAPVLASITITPHTSTVTGGTSFQLTAAGSLTDGTTASLTGAVWSSDNSSVCPVNNSGLVNTVAPGSCNITISSGGITSNIAVLSVLIGKPTGLVAVSVPNQVTISWAPVVGAASYSLYYANTAGVTLSSNRFINVSSPYIPAGLINGLTHYLRVSALYANGETLSDEISVFSYSGINPVGGFSATGGMLFNRKSHTSTLLPNGKVLITGGEDWSTGYLASAELYDPISGTFSLTGSMAMPRAFHSATLLPNGKVLVVGGDGVGGNKVADAELFDPATGTFSAAGSMATPRQNHTAALLSNGKVLIAGGGNLTGELASAELYDPALAAFSPTGSMSFTRGSFPVATLLADGKVLVTGGVNQFVGHADVYEPVTGSFAATPNMVVPRKTHTATLLPNGKVLIAGGSYLGPCGCAELYDPATNGFSPTGSMTYALAGHTASLLSSGKVLLVGGWASFVGSLATAQLYEPATGVFSPAGSTSMKGATNSTPLQNGKVLVTGGSAPSLTSIANPELYQ